MPLADTLNKYRTTVNEVSQTLNIAFVADAGGNYIYPQNQRDFIIESCFLKFFITWESFLEDAFVSFLLGEAPIVGNAVQRHATPIDRTHAAKMLIGTQKYVDWANPQIVRRLSTLYFDQNNPINNILLSIEPDIFDLKTIRNAAAHISSTTSTELDALATRKLQIPCTNYTVSRLILSFDPLAAANNQTIFSSYLILLDAAAENIANG